MKPQLFTDPLLDDEMFDQRFKESLDNSFMIFTGRKTYSEIASDEAKPHFFFFDPETIPTKDDITDLIHIYEDFEEYEKCAELNDLIRNHNR